MNTKKLIVLFTIFSNIALSNTLQNKQSKVDNLEITSNNKMDENEISLDLNTNRILQILDLFALFQEYNNIIEINNSFISLLKNFFGLNITNKQYNNNLEKQLFIENIVLAINQFNEIASSDLKYLCDMQIKYILNFKIMIAKTIKKKSIYSLIVMTYYYYLFSPNEYINLNNDNEESMIEKEISWDESICQIPLEFAELGMLHNGYLYELYDALFISKLTSNKEYNNMLLTKKILPDVIGQDDNALERLIETYTKNIDFFKHDSNLKEPYQKKQEFFLIWLLDKKNIINSIERFFNEDTLFILFTTVLLYKSILKININKYYPKINNELLNSFKSSAQQAEHILYQFFSIFDKQLQINWNKIPIIIINQNRLIEIIKYLKTASIL